MTTFNSDIIAAGNPAKSGIYPQLTRFVVTIPTTTTLLTGDLIKLFKVAAVGRLYAAVIDISGALESGSAGLTGTFNDGTNTYTASAGVVNAVPLTLGGIIQAGGIGLLHLGGTAGRFGVLQVATDTVFQLTLGGTAGGASAAARTINGWALTQND